MVWGKTFAVLVASGWRLEMGPTYVQDLLEHLEGGRGKQLRRGDRRSREVTASSC